MTSNAEVVSLPLILPQYLRNSKWWILYIQCFTDPSALRELTYTLRTILLETRTELSTPPPYLISFEGTKGERVSQLFSFPSNLQRSFDLRFSLMD